jgi:DNA replication licensing factor MCM6
MSFRTEGKRGKDKSLDAVTGLKALGVRDLSYKLCFLVNCIRRHNWQPLEEEIEEELTMSEREEIIKMREQPDLYSRLANSIAPTVIGHEEIKRGILLMLVGGVTKTTPEGMKLRGDINVCIIGDPSTAKS